MIWCLLQICHFHTHKRENNNEWKFWLCWRRIFQYKLCNVNSQCGSPGITCSFGRKVNGKGQMILSKSPGPEIIVSNSSWNLLWVSSYCLQLLLLTTQVYLWYFGQGNGYASSSSMQGVAAVPTELAEQSN